MPHQESGQYGGVTNLRQMSGNSSKEIGSIMKQKQNLLSQPDQITPQKSERDPHQEHFIEKDNDPSMLLKQPRMTLMRS